MRRGCGRGIFKFSRDARGVSAVAAVAALLLFSVLGFSVAGMVAVGGRGAAKTFESQQAFQIAEAGLQYGIWAASEHAEWLLSLGADEEFPLGRGVFTLSAEESSVLSQTDYFNGNGAVWTEGHSAGTGGQSIEPEYLWLWAEGNAERTYVSGEPVDLTGILTLYVEWENTGNAADNRNESHFAVSASQGGDSGQYTARATSPGAFPRMVSELDVSGLSGGYYIRAHARSMHHVHGHSDLRVFRIWGEFVEKGVSGIVSEGYVPGREGYSAKRVTSTHAGMVYHSDEGGDIIWTEGHSAGTGGQSIKPGHLRLWAEGNAERTYVSGEPVDLAGISKIYVEWENTGHAADNRNESHLAVSASQGGDSGQYTARVTSPGAFPRMVSELDVSGLSGGYYIRAHARSMHNVHGHSDLKVFGVSIPGEGEEISSTIWREVKR